MTSSASFSQVSYEFKNVFLLFIFSKQITRIAVRIEVLSGERNHPHCWRTGSNPLRGFSKGVLSLKGSRDLYDLRYYYYVLEFRSYCVESVF